MTTKKEIFDPLFKKALEIIWQKDDDWYTKSPMWVIEQFVKFYNELKRLEYNE